MNPPLIYFDWVMISGYANLPLTKSTEMPKIHLVFVNQGCKFARWFYLKESIKRFFSLDLAAVSDKPAHRKDKEKFVKRFLLNGVLVTNMCVFHSNFRTHC